jgi:hypothetical protein
MREDDGKTVELALFMRVATTNYYARGGYLQQKRYWLLVASV